MLTRSCRTDLTDDSKALMLLHVVEAINQVCKKKAELQTIF
jgi:hypothetical protein